MKTAKMLLAFYLSFTWAFFAHADLSPTMSQMVEKNYAVNGGWENGLAGWAAYKNTAQATPVNGTGGSPTTTVTVSTSSPISDKASGLITRTAANLQGEGGAYTFTLDQAAKGKVIFITGDYQIVSGTYSGGSSTTDSDLEVYIYDVDAAQIIQPAGYKLNGSIIGLTYSFNATFQSNTTSTNYRLLFHEPNTTATAWQVKADNIKIGVQRKSLGVAVTDWVNAGVNTFTAPTGTNPTKGTTTNDAFYWKRIGDKMMARVEYKQSSAGTGGTAPVGYAVTIPASTGCSIDSTKVAFYTATNSGGTYSVTGSAQVGDSGSNGMGNVIVYDATHVRVTTTQSTSSGVNNFWGLAGPGSLGNSVTSLAAEFSVPCAGWASSTVVSDQTDTRLVYAQYYMSANKSASTTTAFDFDTKEFDSHAAVSGNGAAAWKYTVPVPGLYQISVWIGSVSGTSNVFVYKNGSIYRGFSYMGGTGGLYAGNSVLVQFNAGDYFDIRPGTSVTAPGAAITTGGESWISVQRLAGPSQVAATESVVASYVNTSALSLTNNTATTITGWTKLTDSHSAFNTSGIYTVPVSGKYRVTLGIGLAPATSSVGLLQASIVQAGSATTTAANNAAFGSAGGNVNSSVVSFDFPCIAGDTLTLKALQNNGSTIALSATAGLNYFSIERVGN